MAAATGSLRSKYRRLLKLISRLPEPARATECSAARAAFRDNAHASGAAAELLRTKLDDKLRYLRIVTPKRPGDTDDIDEASRVYVLRDGELEQRQGRREKRVADGTMSMSEARERHDRLLRRQHFGRAPPSYDPGTF